MGKIYKGQSISKGVAEGVALVTQQRLNYTFTEVATGKLLQGGSDVYGEIAKDRIMVIPSMVANIDMWKLYWCWKEGTAPKAIVAIEADDYIIAGTNLSGIPCVHRLNVDPTKEIKTGQKVKVDGDKGTVEVMD
jgi:phosphomecalonate degydratase small subunit